MEVTCGKCKVKMKLVMCEDGIDCYECPKCGKKYETACDFDEEYS